MIDLFNESNRLFVISDIHGGLHLLKRHLNRWDGKSAIVFLGDIIEKGKHALDTFLFIREMDRQDMVYVLLGNNDIAFLKSLKKENVNFFMSRIHNKQSIICQMIERHQFVGIGEDLQIQIKNQYRDEIAWLESRLLLLETKDFIFVHAGISPDGIIENTTREMMLSMDNFYQLGHQNKKTVICGHYPTAMYNHHNFNNNIIIDHHKRIICIDGGYGATNFGQLNMLEIIKEHQGYHYVAYEEDDFISKKIIAPQIAKGSKRGVCYPDYDIDMLEEKEFFSLVRIKRTNEEVYAKNEFITHYGNQYRTLDDTPNNWLGVEAGDWVKILNDNTAGFALVKKDGIFGWVKYACIEGYEHKKQ